ncbi:MAG: electron transport complex subunit RsxC [Caldicoprobacterales bacterium]
MFKRNLTFLGGVLIPQNKQFTETKQLEYCKIPELVTIPLQQHIGAPCQVLVKKGDKVLLGQKIGQPRGYVGAPVHSSVSGTVKSIESVDIPNGGKASAVIISNDGQDQLDESIKPVDFEKLNGNELKNIIMESGIVGMGGAVFPTHVKLSPPIEKKIDYVILNGSESEPYLTSDYRLMLEHPEDVIDGLKIIMKILNASEGYIGIEDNKPQAIKTISDASRNEKTIYVKSLRSKFPQGSEKQLIKVITNRVVPSGKLPMDVGVVVQNVSTAAAIARAIKTGKPLYERIVTVSGGAVREPKNLIVRIGTSFKDVIDFCGGFKEEPIKVIEGGPMMGTAQHTLNVPVVKGTSGILAFTKTEAFLRRSSNCIRCGRCSSVCPIRLIPFKISTHSLKGNMDEAEKLHVLDCIECGSCSYICPASRPLLQSIKVAKKEIIEARKEKAQSLQ